MNLLPRKKHLAGGFTLLSCLLLLFLVIYRPFADSQQVSNPVSERSEESSRRTGAWEALQLMQQVRAYPNRDIPSEGFYNAWQYVNETMRPASKTDSSSQGTWEPIGPVNQGGRTLALAFNPQNPNTIYAGAAGGGLWVSRTAGRGANAWSYIPTGFPVLGVSSIAINPQDSNEIYIGTGEVYNYQNTGTQAALRPTRGSYGIGILKSTDGGQTWTHSLNWAYNQERGVQVVRINPQNPNRIWAGTTEGTYTSSDAGATWTLSHNLIMVNDLVIHSRDTNIIVTGAGNVSSAGGGIYRTTDNGATWNQITQGIPPSFGGKIQLAAYASNPDILYASIGDEIEVSNLDTTWLCRSTNAGATWSVVSYYDYSRYQGWFAHDVGISPVDSSKLILIGIHTWVSNDGGQSMLQVTDFTAYQGVVLPGDPEGLSDYSHPDHHDILWHPTNPNIVYVANDGGVFRTTDGGSTWEGCNGHYQTTQFYNGFSTSKQDTNFAMGGMQDNNTAYFLGISAWSKFHIGGDGAWTGIHPTDPNILYGSAQYLNMAVSTDGGSSYQFMNLPGSNRPTLFIAPFEIAHNDGSILYAGRDIIYKTTDGGFTWFPTGTGGGQVLDGNPAFAMAISPSNDAVAYVATFPLSTTHNVFRTANGGNTWQNITNTLPNRVYTDLAVDPNDEGRLAVTLGGFGTSHVFISNDYGNSWTDIGTGLPDVPAQAVAFDEAYPDHLYVGTDLGVFATKDGGQSWSDCNSGLPDAVMAYDLKVSSKNRKLRMATHGNGAYQLPLPALPLSAPGPSTAEPEASLGPNPFSYSTRLNFTAPEAGTVELQILNAAGQLVRRTWLGWKQAGTHNQRIRRNELAAGLYYLRLQSEAWTHTIKMVVVD